MAMNDVLVRFEAFVQRQRERAGHERLSNEALEGLEVAHEALIDIVAGRMKL